MAPRPRKQPGFRTEAELCEAFVAVVGPDWVSYPETAGWDILLVHRATGSQIGIQAKLKLNAKVLLQSCEESYRLIDAPGPDYRAVLVPAGSSVDLARLAAYVGLTVLQMEAPDQAGAIRPPFSPNLPGLTSRHLNPHWHELLPMSRCELPEYVPDVRAGAPAPLALTAWKIKAIKVALLLEARGYVTRADFKRMQIDIRRWITGKRTWLRAGEQGFVRGPGFPDFRGQHPVNWEQIKANMPKWAPSNAASG